MNKTFPKVKIDKVDLIENEYHAPCGRIWSTVKLIEASKKYEVFDLPLIGIDISRLPWPIDSISDFVHHVDRMRKTDLRHPILLDDEGIVCDGYHRVAKAILEGKTTIKAVRLDKMPPEDRTEKHD